eukprot:scaffold11500_cov44-Phaeocystis_antarctica.AAC.2
MPASVTPSRRCLGSAARLASRFAGVSATRTCLDPQHPIVDLPESSKIDRFGHEYQSWIASGSLPGLTARRGLGGHLTEAGTSTEADTSTEAGKQSAAGLWRVLQNNSGRGCTQIQRVRSGIGAQAVAAAVKRGKARGPLSGREDDDNCVCTSHESWWAVNSTTSAFPPAAFGYTHSTQQT